MRTDRSKGEQNKDREWLLRQGAKKRNSRKKLSPGELRVQKDISELDGGDCAVADFPDPNNLMNFFITGNICVCYMLLD